MRVLGVDFGFERIGLAVGETDHQLASPRPVLSAAGSLKKDAEAIARLAKSEGADLVVVGLPLEQDQVEGRMARITRQLAGHLETLGCKVAMVDESLTSVNAETVMWEAGLKAAERKRKRDSEAACQILERYFHGHETKV
ncbi:MAG: Holliday junction resolvase RuvX [Fimbriimonas sp.]